MQQLIGTELEVSCKNEDSLLVKVTVQLYVLGIERDIAVDNVNVGYLENRYTGWTKKKWDLKNNGHNSSEIHQKGKKLLCVSENSALMLQDRHQTVQN